MRSLLPVVLTSALVGCASPGATAAPNDAGPTPPPAWVTVSNVEGTIQLTIPPYISVGDRQGAIFANEAPRLGTTETPIQLWAEGPVIDGAPGVGDDLAAWVDQRLESPAEGVPTITLVSLPAGIGIRYDRVDAAGTPQAWRIVVFAIRTARGPAWLMIDGPPGEWAARAADLERIPGLFRIR